ncbi:MAG: hypothetical protein H6772_04480 [Pseudomonadales bacterium]|nr:hypothetical protein [Pseudomonadales bacterium]
MNTRNHLKHYISTLIEHDNEANYFDVFIEWLESEAGNFEGKVEKETILNNPSFRFMNPEGESIKIEDVRNFNQDLSFSNYDLNRRYFVFFNSDLATLQAQNAALKSIEEPPVNTQIVLLTTTIEKLLPTIISRCEVVSLKKSLLAQNRNFTQIAQIYKTILSSKHFELIEFSNTYKDRVDADKLLSNLLNFLHQELTNKSSIYPKNTISRHLKIILETLKMLSQNTNTKLTIENCFFKMINQ